MAPLPKPGGGRRGSIKTKTGCGTCRKRKIKCDEARPSCHRCEGTGRKCDGYTKPPPQSSQVQIWHPEQHRGKGRDVAIVNIEHALATLIASAEEKRALYYFREKAAPVLAGSLDSSFWSRLVLQVGDSEPAVRLAMMAVGSLFEHVQYQGSTESPTKDTQAIVTGRRYRFAIQCYNRAIAALLRRLAHDDSSEDIALLTCILFICVEFLQGNEAEALALCVKGSNVLHSMQLVDCDSGRRATPVPQLSDKSTMIVEDIVPIFTRLGILSALFGQPIDVATSLLTLTDSPPTEISYSFSHLSEARTALYRLMEACQKVIRAARECKWAPESSPTTLTALSPLHTTMLANLANWSRAFTPLDRSSDSDSDSDPSAPLSANSIYASTLLRLYHGITTIWTSTCIYSSETVFDTYTPAFASIVAHAESVLLGPTATPMSHALPLPQPHFTFEMGLIPPLYFTAINCRHRVLRRRAVALLRRSPRRESLWDAEPIAKIAERVIEMEERGLVEFEGTGAGAGAADAWPAEECRVHDAAIHQKVTGGEGGWSGYPVEFRRRPGGLEGPFEFVSDFIRIQG